MIPIFYFHGLFGMPDDWSSFSTDPSFRPSLYGFASIDSFVENFKEKLQQYSIQKINLMGYSMGGRLALAFAMKYPHFINSLVLESASPGISNDQERQERFRHDQNLLQNVQTRDDLRKILEEIY